MDDEVEVLDFRVLELESQVAHLESILIEIRREWDEEYPYEALEWAQETIQRLVQKILQNDPEDLESQELLREIDIYLVPKLMEPELTYLT